MPTPSSSSPPSPLSKWYHHLSEPQYDKLYINLLLTFELFLCLFILYKIPYTEIDWKAYMEEVTTYQQGERNYINIRGGTGPLVYPAGFVYLYSLLKYVTGATVETTMESIFLAQCIFVGFYMINLWFVLKIYDIVLKRQRDKVTLTSNNNNNNNSNKVANTVWSWRICMSLLTLSKRIHSIFILRLFNDAPCMLLFYISLYLFIHHQFKKACLFFSLAVSIKMNVLLFAPGLLLVLLQWNERKCSFWGTVECLGICAIVQVIVGVEFLLTYPVSYLRKAFEFDRVFFYKWTVNWKVSLHKVLQYSVYIHALSLITHYFYYFLSVST